MNLVNLTQHVINLFNAEGVEVATLEPSGTVARIDVTRTSEPSGMGFDFHYTKEGAVTGLPDPVPGVIYVASMAVRKAVPGRPDVASPGPAILGPDGRPVGAKGLDRNLPA